MIGGTGRSVSLPALCVGSQKLDASLAGTTPTLPRSVLKATMHGLIYFDTEDFISPPDSPVHRLPGQMAEIMTKHGLPGCFHIHGEKARFMERHGQTDVIDAIRKHDVSLHYDRGSMHPTTAEEVSELDWFRGVDRVLYREVRGFRDLERIFGKCSAITQHGGTFAAPIVYAAGKLGKPFFYSPFRLPDREVVWFCGNLLFGGARVRPPWPNVVFDTTYRDTAQFDQKLALVDDYIAERARTYDLTCMFGCHPVITMMQRFPGALNFSDAATAPATGRPESSSHSAVSAGHSNRPSPLTSTGRASSWASVSLQCADVPMPPMSVRTVGPGVLWWHRYV